MTTGLQYSKRYVCIGSREVAWWCNYMERRFRRQSKLLIKLGHWDTLPVRPGAIDWIVA